MWSSKCTQRIKFFAWLLLVDRLNIKMMLLRRNFHVQPNTYCVMCSSSAEEDIDHLFFFCPFAARCWQNLDIQWMNANDIYDRILLTASNTGIPFFMEIFLVASWEIWNMRNSRIFYNGRPTFRLWLTNFKQQAYLQLLRVREIDRPPIVQWLESLT